MAYLLHILNPFRQEIVDISHYFTASRHNSVRESGFGDITYMMFSPSAIMMATAAADVDWMAGDWPFRQYKHAPRNPGKVTGYLQGFGHWRWGSHQIHQRQALVGLFGLCYPLLLGAGTKKYLHAWKWGISPQSWHVVAIWIGNITLNHWILGHPIFRQTLFNVFPHCISAISSRKLWLCGKRRHSFSARMHLRFRSHCSGLQSLALELQNCWCSRGSPIIDVWIWKTSNPWLLHARSLERSWFCTF